MSFGMDSNGGILTDTPSDVIKDLCERRNNQDWASTWNDHDRAGAYEMIMAHMKWWSG